MSDYWVSRHDLTHDAIKALEPLFLGFSLAASSVYIVTKHCMAFGMKKTLESSSLLA